MYVFIYLFRVVLFFHSVTSLMELPIPEIDVCVFGVSFFKICFRDM